MVLLDALDFVLNQNGELKQNGAEAACSRAALNVLQESSCTFYAILLQTVLIESVCRQLVRAHVV